MSASSLDNVAQHGGQFPLLHLSGHLTPYTKWTESGAQTVVAQRPLSTKKRSETTIYDVNKPLNLIKSQHYGLV